MFCSHKPELKEEENLLIMKKKIHETIKPELLNSLMKNDEVVERGSH